MTAMNINEHASTAQQLDSTALHVKDVSVGYGERTVLTRSTSTSSEVP